MTPRVGDGQGGLACCDSWGHKESDMTEQLNRTECYAIYILNALVNRDSHDNISLASQIFN